MRRVICLRSRRLIRRDRMVSAGGRTRMTAALGIETFGWLLLCGGLALDALGAAGMAFYEVRRRLPVASPLRMFDFGCPAFFVGICAVALGRGLA